jgi:hypothetical protein
MIGYSDSSKSQIIHKAFLGSYKSPLLLIFIDDIGRIIEYVPIELLQALLVLLNRVPPDQGRRLLVIGSTSCPHFLEELGLVQAFCLTQSVLLFEEPPQITEVLRMAGHMNEHDATSIARAITKPIGMKRLLMVAEMARQGSDGRYCQYQCVYGMPPYGWLLDKDNRNSIIPNAVIKLYNRSFCWLRLELSGDQHKALSFESGWLGLVCNVPLPCRCSLH